jgi:hypothetical protein
MTQHVIFDIESMVSDKLHDYQAKLFGQLAGGIAPGEMIVYTAGRQTGKSLYADYAKMFNDVMLVRPNYEQMETATIDNEQWVSVKCNREIAAWVREQNTKYWYEHKGGVHAIFDINDKLYTILKLTFTP